MIVLNSLKRVRGFAFASLLSGACLALPINGAEAQTRGWDLQGTLGAAVPFGDLSDVTETGVGLGFGPRWANKWLGFHLGSAVNMLGAKGAGPDLDLWHYNVGLEGDVINPSTSNFRLHLNVGLGGTRTTTAKDLDSQTDFTVNGGPNLEYAFSRR